MIDKARECGELAEGLGKAGMAVANAAVPADVCAACQKALGPVLARHAGGEGNRPGGPKRFYIPLPLVPPFTDLLASVLSNSAITGAVAARIGVHAAGAVDEFASDTPFPNASDFQPLHSDIYQGVPVLGGGWENQRNDVPLICANIPLIDVLDRSVGPFEAVKGTHAAPVEQGLRNEPKPEPVYLRAGDVLLRDARMLHRGTPNVSRSPRPVVVVSFRAPWFIRASDPAGVAELHRTPSLPLTAPLVYERAIFRAGTIPTAVFIVLFKIRMLYLNAHVTTLMGLRYPANFHDRLMSKARIAANFVRAVLAEGAYKWSLQIWKIARYKQKEVRERRQRWVGG